MFWSIAEKVVDLIVLEKTAIFIAYLYTNLTSYIEE